LIYTLISPSSVDLSIPNGHGLPEDVGEVLQCRGNLWAFFFSAAEHARYGYQGSVADMLARLGTVEAQDSFEPPMDRFLVPGAILAR